VGQSAGAQTLIVEETIMPKKACKKAAKKAAKKAPKKVAKKTPAKKATPRRKVVSRAVTKLDCGTRVTKTVSQPGCAGAAKKVAKKATKKACK